MPFNAKGRHLGKVQYASHDEFSSRLYVEAFNLELSVAGLQACANGVRCFNCLDASLCFGHEAN
jgi:hypothetical protein